MLTDDLIISDMILDSVMVSFKMLGCTSHCMGSGGIVGVFCIAVLNLSVVVCFYLWREPFGYI